MISKRLPSGISEALTAGATLLVPSVQRQAAIRAAWAREQEASGRTLWETPRVFTFLQYCERALGEQWASRGEPDRLMSPGAEWALVRQLRRSEGGTAEARALLTSVRTIDDFRIPKGAAALGGSPESELLLGTLTALESAAAARGRRPLRQWLDALEPASGRLLAVPRSHAPTLERATCERLGATASTRDAPAATLKIAAADNDEHELELIATWCRRELEKDPSRRLLIVDARLRQRRGQYERVLSQALSPSEWVGASPRELSAQFAIEGGRPLAEFPLIAHALTTLRLLTGRLRFDEIVQWLRLPFLDDTDVLANAAVESLLRTGRKLEYSAEELAEFLGRPELARAAIALAARLRRALAALGTGQLRPAEWSPQLLSALRLAGWFGSRPLRSDEQQTVARWHALLDEYAALGAWMPRASAAEAVATLTDLASERNFDAATVDAPVTLTDSHEDPIVRYDGIWIAGLDAAQWPLPPRPDVFIPLGLQVAAGVPWASAAAQASVAAESLAAWRRAAERVVCSWARLEGDAHRTMSPLLRRVAEQEAYGSGEVLVPLAQRLRAAALETLDDVEGVPIDTSARVAGGVKPLALQSECGFHAYGELRLRGEKLETPAPGLDARERGMILHKALELIWIRLDRCHFVLSVTDEPVRRPLIADAVAAAVVFVFRGYVPVELRPAVDRETHRVEVLIEKLLEIERGRVPFEVDAMETRREVIIAGGVFDLRIDRIDVIEGGGVAILDYKSGEPRALRWQGSRPRDPQLIAYLMAERGRNIQALANVSLTSGRAVFTGRASRKGLLPGVNGVAGMLPSKVPSEQIEAAWQQELARLADGITDVAREYIAGLAPVEPESDVCRNCHLTTLCRRVELAALEELPGSDP